MAGRLILAFAGIALLAATTARAQLADPMRPPAGLGAKTSAGDTAETGDGGSPVQAVILRRGDKPVALIAGERVTIGSRVGDARVVAITDSEVVLASRSGRQVIKINPDVDKKIHDGTPPPATEKKKAERRKKPMDAQGESSK
jgi:MSHA biogenesis protein MshK